MSSIIINLVLSVFNFVMAKNTENKEGFAYGLSMWASGFCAAVAMAMIIKLL